jgi:uncharacterized protein (TIGR02145 family)
MSKSVIMGKVYWINQIILAASVLLLATGCKKEEITGDIVYPVTHWPIVKASEVTNRTDSTATLNGIVNTYGLSTTVTFEYGTTTGYGSIVTATQSPVTGDSITNVSVNISGLTPRTPYHFRVRAENSLWTNFYSGDMEFRFPTDADGNAYNTVAIGRQIWLVENLKTTTYLNGDPILSNLRGSEWTNSTSGAYHISSDIYGNLYNAYAVADERKVCPAGWHVPSVSEWDELINYLGGEEYAGGPMKEAGTSHWLELNVGATNESGFTALPAGIYTGFSVNGNSICNVGYNALWWSSSDNTGRCESVYCEFSHTQCFIGGYDMNMGLSVRCIKDSLNSTSSAPFLSTGNITNITETTAESGGNISSDGEATITSRGVCWSTTGRPTTSDSKTVDGDGIGPYLSSITGLTPGTTYHVRAYATNSVGTRYGEDMTFSTSGVSPYAPATQPATNVSVTKATLNGTINAHNYNTWVTFEYGTTTDYGQEVTSVQQSVTGNTITDIYAKITCLKAYTTYHFRAKAENSLGIFYGSDMEFTTPVQSPPTVNTYSATNITYITATLNGDVIANNLPSVVTFEYGTTTNYGQSVTCEQNLSTGDSIINVSATITGLPRCTSTTYHFRIKAENSLGVVYGSDLTFETKKIPTLTTSVSGITATTAILGGNITDEGCSPITDRGVEIWRVGSTGRPGPRLGIIHLGTGTGSFTSNFGGFSPSTGYFVRAFATNSTGTFYGNWSWFKTASSGK